MFLNLLIGLQLVVLTFGNPFRKYPYVFLLDVGNEELENTTKEQIRVTVPGGSLAIRYPAIENSETISHVRVCGIDFGTDLKANIIEGGPGYKYVVIAFMGNSAVPYDAVITVQTLINDLENDVMNDNLNTSGDVAVDSQKEEVPEKKTNDEYVISYEPNINYNEKRTKPFKGYDNDNTPNYSQGKQINEYNDEEDKNFNNDIEEKSAVDIKESNDIYVKSQDRVKSNPKVQLYNNGHIYDVSYDGEQPDVEVDKELHDKYRALQPHLYGKAKAEEVQEIPNENSEKYIDETGQKFNDEEVHDDTDINSIDFSSEDGDAADAVES